MSEQSVDSWSNNPNAPQISPKSYHSEKAHVAGILIGALLYGVVITLFFQCMGALLNPIDRTRGSPTKWGLVAHTMIMFSLTTVYTGMGLDILSVCYIDNREFHLGDGPFPPGPDGYWILLYQSALAIVPNTLFLVNSWLADGILLYRCFIIYARNYWVIALPCLMYLASVAMGITIIYQTSQPVATWESTKIGAPFYSISLALNVLLTLMISIRLILHSRDIRNALGPLVKADRLYTTIVTILVESSALYAVNSLLYIGPWYAENLLASIFITPLTVTQVISPFFITLRIANRTALTSEDVTTGNIIGSLHFNSQGGSANCNETFAESDESPGISMGVDGETPAEHSIGDENIIEQVPL